MFTPATHVDDELMTLVNKANGTLVAGEFKIDATGSDSTVYQVTKLRNRTVQLEGGGTEQTAVYGIGVDASDKEGSAPNNTLSVNLPTQ